MRASELIQKLQVFVDRGEDFEVWMMAWDEAAPAGEPETILNDGRIYI